MKIWSPFSAGKCERTSSRDGVLVILELRSKRRNSYFCQNSRCNIQEGIMWCQSLDSQNLIPGPEYFGVSKCLRHVSLFHLPLTPILLSRLDARLFVRCTSTSIVFSTSLRETKLHRLPLSSDWSRITNSTKGVNPVSCSTCPYT